MEAYSKEKDRFSPLRLRECTPLHTPNETITNFDSIEDTIERSKIRLARHYMHAISYHKLAEENPDKIVIADRSIYSCSVYMEAFLKLGWVCKEQYNEHIKLINLLFEEKYKPKNIIVINPSIEELVMNIQKRWERKKKWKEENVGYLMAVKESYENLVNNNSNILCLEVYNLDERVKIASEWINKIINDKTQAKEASYASVSL